MRIAIIRVKLHSLQYFGLVLRNKNFKGKKNQNQQISFSVLSFYLCLKSDFDTISLAVIVSNFSAIHSILRISHLKQNKKVWKNCIRWHGLLTQSHKYNILTYSSTFRSRNPNSAVRKKNCKITKRRSCC